MSKQKLRFKVKIEGREAGVVASIIPPVDVPEVFGTRARVPVRGSINGFPFRSSLMPMGGCHMMPVNRTLREGAGVKPGDNVVVVMERDDEVRTVAAPVVLKKALAKKTLEVDFLKAACAKVAALSQTGTGSGTPASGKQSGK